MFRSRSLALAGLVAAALSAAACTGNPASPSITPPFSKTDISEGTGTEAVVGNPLTVNYTGWLYDVTKPDQKGLMFDTSLGKTTFSFTLGAAQVIGGWDVGVVGMKVGGTRRLVIPPSLGYKDQRAGPIPPNSTLVFDIELVSIP